MDKLNRLAWGRYVKTRNLSLEEQADERLCDKLRETLDFHLCLSHTAWCNFGNEILRSLGVKR